MKTNIIKNRRGILSFFWITLFVMGIMGMYMSVLYNLLEQQITLTRTQINTAQGYYYASLGIKRAKWHLDGASPLPASFSEYVIVDVEYVDNSGGISEPNIDILVKLNAQSNLATPPTYTITSTVYAQSLTLIPTNIAIEVRNSMFPLPSLELDANIKRELHATYSNGILTSIQ